MLLLLHTEAAVCFNGNCAVCCVCLCCGSCCGAALSLAVVASPVPSHLASSRGASIVVTAKKPDKRHKPFTRVCNCPFSNLINHRLSFRQVGVAVVWFGVVWFGLVWFGFGYVWLWRVLLCVVVGACIGRWLSATHLQECRCNALATPRQLRQDSTVLCATTGQSHLNSLDLLSLPARTTLLPTTSLL